VAGAGLSGAVVARELAEAGLNVDVYDGRDHVAGNCHTQIDSQTGVLVHVYGPHIFHTKWHDIWRYVNRFGSLVSYAHRVKATAQNRVYSLPVNLLTINQFFDATFSPAEAIAFLAERTDATLTDPKTFEEQALRFVGKELYEAFFAGYTAKQWGRPPSELPASVLKRLPLRFNYDDVYFVDPYIGIPRGGYTSIVESMLDHPRITVHLGHPLNRTEAQGADHCFWTGCIDDYFAYEHGALGYRTLDFQVERYEGDFQGCPVMNYCDEDIPYTRTTEFKHFAPWDAHEDTLVYREFSRAHTPGDIPYYPIRLADEVDQLSEYVELARGETKVSFLGRLGTYRYLDMDVSIKEARDAAAQFLEARGAGQQAPVFFTDPLAG